MPEGNITQIRIHSSLVGIIGLKQVMEKMVDKFAFRPDEEIGAEMISRLSEFNYIPKQARTLYTQALIKEFKKYLGQPVDEAPVEGLRIAVLGPGCARCSRMEMDVREAMAEMKLAGELIHVSDIREIARSGVMGTPALVINDRVVCVGQTPHRNQIKAWLKEAMSSERKE
jgi:small redox-active disulfide protein 2